MDFYLNTTLKDYFGFSENYQITCQQLNDKNQYILQSSLPNPQLPQLISHYLTEFEKYMKGLIQYEYSNAGQITIKILDDHIVIDFILLNFKTLLDDYLSQTITIEKKSLRIDDDGVIIDYLYEAIVYPQIKTKNELQFNLKIGDFKSTLRKKLENYIATLFNDRIYAALINFIWPKTDVNFHSNLEIIISLSRKRLKMPNDYIVSHVGFNEEQIKSSPFVYIQHITFMPSLKLILEHGKLQNRLSLSRQRIPVHYGLAGAYEDEFHIEESAYQLKQFPGIYTTLVTQYDLLYANNKINKGIEDPIILVFSLSLLKQQNWHFNLEDQYGTINNGTFSPVNLAKYLNLLKPFYGQDNTAIGLFERELIFHDDLPIQLVDCILVNSDEMKLEVENILSTYNYQIPVYRDTRKLRNEFIFKQLIRETDNYLNNNLPQLCYTNIMDEYPADDDNITHYMNNFKDINPYKLEKIDNVDIGEEKAYVWQRMLDNCNIDEKYEPERAYELFKKIEDRLQALYFEDAPRIPVKEENLPPFKYTPDWY